MLLEGLAAPMLFLSPPIQQDSWRSNIQILILLYSLWQATKTLVFWAVTTTTTEVGLMLRRIA